MRIDQFLAEEPNLVHACKDVNMTITTESVTVVDMDNCDVRNNSCHNNCMFHRGFGSSSQLLSVVVQDKNL